MDSILVTTKKFLGVEDDYSGFDNDIILCINTAFMSLNQLGVGPPEGYKIASTNEDWEEVLGVVLNLEGVNSYVCLKVKLLFDPPTNSFLIDAIKNQITELEWRLTVQAEPPVV